MKGKVEHYSKSVVVTIN